MNGDLQLSSSEKRLSVPLYSDLDVTKSIEIKKGEENNLLDVGDLEKLNGRLSTQVSNDFFIDICVKKFIIIQ